MLEDSDLFNNLEHILAYIEFDDTEHEIGMSTYAGGSQSTTSDDEDIIVTKDQFYDLKTNKTAINMHNGIRILEYLKKILFKTEEKEITEDDLEDFETNIDNSDEEQTIDKTETENKETIKRNIYVRSIWNYINRMSKSLIEKRNKPENLIPNSGTFRFEKSKAELSLNSASALAVLATAMCILPSKYKGYYSEYENIQWDFLYCCSYHFSLYGQRIQSADTTKDRKIKHIIHEATVMYLNAVSLFSFAQWQKGNKDDLKLCILNCCDTWGNNKVELKQIFEEFQHFDKEEIVSNRNETTYNTITDVIKQYIEDNEIPTLHFSELQKRIFIYKKDFGFFIADNIKREVDGWSYDMYQPGINATSKSNQKFKGYYDI